MQGQVAQIFRLFPGATRLLSLLVLVAFFFAEAPLFAATLYWDTNGSTLGATTATGTWINAGTTWSTDSTGLSAIGSTTTSILDSLVVSAGTEVTGTSSITISGAQAANSLTFNNGTVTLAGTAGNSLTLGSGGLTMNSTLNGTLTFNSTLTSVILSGSQAWTNFSTRALSLSSATAVSGNATAGNTNLWTLGGPGTGAATIAGTISDGLNGGRLSLLKTGSTTLTLTGSNAYTGDTTIREGGISLTFAAAGTDGVNRISSSTALILGDATPGTGAWTRPNLTATGSAGQNNAQTFASTTVFSARNAVITAGTAATGSMTINLGTITAGSYATLNLTNPNTSSGTISAGDILTPTGTLTAGSVNASGMLGTWLTTGTSGTQGTDWVARSGTSLVPYTGYTVYAGSGNITSGGTQNLTVTTGTVSASITTPAGTTDVNTIRLTGTATTTLALGGTLRLGGNPETWGGWRDILVGLGSGWG